jgi:hypothetical protein
MERRLPISSLDRGRRSRDLCPLRGWNGPHQAQNRSGERRHSQEPQHHRQVDRAGWELIVRCAPKAGLCLVRDADIQPGPRQVTITGYVPLQHNGGSDQTTKLTRTKLIMERSSQLARFPGATSCQCRRYAG